MSYYSITFDLSYYINDVIDQLVIAFPDVDFKGWFYDDEPCTLLGYEDGDYPPNDFFRCDKFYVEIQNRQSIRFEFDDKQQSVYILNGSYVCDYFTQRLANFFNIHFEILDQYGLTPNEHYDDNEDEDEDEDEAAELYQFMDSIVDEAAIACNEYNQFIEQLDEIPDVNQVICTYQTKLSKPVSYFKNNNTYNEQLCSNGKLILTFLPDKDGYFDINFIKNTMDHTAWMYDLDKDDYVITNKNTKRKFYGGINGLFQATFYEGKTYDEQYANNTIKPTITCEMRTKIPTQISCKLDYRIPNTDDYYNVEVRKDNMIFATFPCSLNGDYDHDLVYSIMGRFTSQYGNSNNDYLIINNQTGTKLLC